MICGFRFPIWTIFIVLTFSIIVSAQEEIRLLMPIEQVEREFKGGETHAYRITLDAGQFVHLEVIQNGIDVTVLLFAADGRKLEEIDSPNGTNGPEPLWFVTEAAGSYRLEIKSLEKNAPAGKYTAKIFESRASKEKDKTYITAQKFLSEAELLWAQDTEEAMPKAKKSFEEALRLIPVLDDLSQLARIHERIGRIYLSFRDYENGLKHFTESLKSSEKLGNRDRQAVALHKIGEIYFYQSSYQQAIDFYQRSLNLWNPEDKRSIGSTSNNLGLIYFNVGDFDKALPMFEKTLRIGEETGSKRHIASSLNNIGLVYSAQGNPGKSLEYQFKQLALAEGIGDTAVKLRALYNIAIDHPNSAIKLEYQQKVLALAEELNDKRIIGNILHDMAARFVGQDNQKALEYFEKYETLDESYEKKGGFPAPFINLGVIYKELGDFEKAMKNLQRSLAIAQRLGMPEYESDTLLEIARVYLYQKNHPKALETVQKAAAVIKDKDFAGYLWQAHSLKGQILLSMNEPAKASEAFQDSITVIEKSRAKQLIGLPEQIHPRKELLVPYYELLKLLVKDNKQEEAFALAESTKARILLDILLAGKTTIKKALTAKEQEQERKLKNELISLNAQISKEKQQQQSDKTRLSDLQNQLEKKRLEFEDFQTRLYAVHPELKVQRGEMKPVSLFEAGELISDEKTALLEFVVAEDKTFLFVITKDSAQKPLLKVYPIAIKQKDLAERVGSFRLKLAKGDLDFQKSSRELFDLLIKPAQAQITGKTNLIIVPDSVLWDLPFQALQTNQNRYLIEQTALSYAPSLTALREMTKKTKKIKSNSQLELLAFGNPVIGKETKERVKQVFMSESLEPIPEAERMVAALQKMYGAQKSKVFVGSEAREETAKNESSKYRIVQFATHGILNNSSPMYSHLLLAQDQKNPTEDGLLEAWEMKDLNLNADMVILSACETARGRVSNGEGVIGMSWALFIAGAPTTVVSQWKVESASTTELMLEFHRQLLTGKNISKAEALRRASLKLMKTPQYKHPSYWAPFVIVGDAF